MVIPWTGFPLNRILKEVEPTSDALFVKFTTVFRPEEMVGQRSSFYPWPYTEGLRLDEAMHDLTLLVTGCTASRCPIKMAPRCAWLCHGNTALKASIDCQDRAGRHSAKTFWNTIASNEYGFYSNVNPEVPHPRWSQQSERRIGRLPAALR